MKYPQLCAVALAVFVLAGGTAASAQAPAANPKPNILFILADNLGYGEIGSYGGGITRGAATPRIDSLAKDGMRLLASRPLACSGDMYAAVPRMPPTRRAGS